MQPQDIEKLKKLIDSSSLLSPGEKQEWRALLGLMNDKQLKELENILTSNFKPIVPVTRPQKLETTPAAHLNKPGLPSLKHIINLPTDPGNAAHFKSLNPELQKTKAAPEEKAKTNQGFWQKVKDVLKEKELPPAHPEPMRELELPASLKPAPSSKFNNTTAGMLPEEKLTLHPPVKPLVVPTIPVPSPLSPKLPTLSPPGMSPSPSEKTDLKVGTLSVDKLIMPSSEQPNAVGGSIFGKPRMQKTKDDDMFVPGLKNSGILVNAKLAGKRESFSVGGFHKKAEPKPLPKLLAPADASKLSLSDLEDSDQQDLVSAVKNLGSQFGYHKVVLNLEKSPIFKSYLTTGLQVLSGQYDLDADTKQGFLNREDFEKMADLLREIKN